MTSTEEMKTMIVAAGGDISALPDNLETTLYKALCEALGVDISDMTDNLATSYMKQIATEFTGGGGDEANALDSLIDRSIIEISSNATSIGDYAFSRCTALTTADFPVATSIGDYAFSRCDLLTTADFPFVTSIGTRVFDGCKSLTIADFPLITSISNYTFTDCYALKAVNFPLVTSIGAYAFSGCYALKAVDFPLVTSIGLSVFNNCRSLTTLILRSENVCSLSHTNAFNSCYHILGTTNATYNPNGDKDGYIYVPRSLVESYQSATNWSTYASQFRALEDYTVDGTITGELDESKI